MDYIRESVDTIPFTNAYPNKGSGKMRANNVRKGSGQLGVRVSTKQKVECRICGFKVDKSRFSSEGGSEDGNGGTYVDDGEPMVSPGKGCPHCGSLNYT